MGLFGPSGSEIEQTAKEMAEHSVKNGQLDKAGIGHAMVIGMRFVRFRKTGVFKASSLCSRYKLNLIGLGVTNEEAEELKQRLIITLQVQAKQGLVFWPPFLGSWFAKPKTAWDELQENPIFQQHKDLYVTYGALFFILAAIWVALGWLVSWWFLLGILVLLKTPVLLRRARVWAVLASEYQYEFPPRTPQAYTLCRIERETRSQKLNDHELATLFMAVMCNSLSGGGSDVRAFCQKVRENAMRLRYFNRVISDDVFEQLSDTATDIDQANTPLHVGQDEP